MFRKVKQSAIFAVIALCSQTAFSQIAKQDIDDQYISAESPIMMMAAGAWTSNAVGPNLTQKGVNYTVNLPVVGSVPTGATITSVNYKWSLSRIPTGLNVYLCRGTTSTCVAVTSSLNGSIANFNGLAANQKFLFVFNVTGTGTISPVVYGQSDQVIVNYQ